MRFAARSAVVFSILCLMFFGVIGCGGLGTLEQILPPGTINRGGNNAIINTWKQTQLSVDAIAVACPGTVTLPSGATKTCTAEVRTYSSNGNWNSTNPSGAASGTWTESGNTLTLTPNGGSVLSGTITYGNSNNLYTFTYGSTTETWQKQ